MNRIKKGDTVTVIAGGQKGKTGVVAKVEGDKIFIEKVNVKTRHIRPNQLNPRGGKKDIHVGIHASNVALVDGEKPTRVAYKVKDGRRIRVSKKSGKEIK